MRQVTINTDNVRDRDAKVFMFDQKPTRVGSVVGITFYECPLDGDESPLMVQNGEGYSYSHHWDLPTLLELLY